MLWRSFRLVRLFGVDIEIHPSWLLILALVAYSLSDALFPDQYDDWSTAAYWLVGSSAAVLLFVTVLIHEMAHAIVARRRGLPVNRITLFIFGGVSHLEQQPRTAGEEFAIAVAGPVTSLVIGIATGAAALAAGNVPKLEAMLYYLGSVNILLAVFNILPGFPLDGGRVLRSIAWGRTRSFRRATRIAGNVGELFAYVLMAAGVLVLLGIGDLGGLWLMLIGWFLLGAARAETQRLQLDVILSRLVASHVMRQEFPSVQPGLSVQEVVDRHMVGEGERAVMVANDGSVLGILTVSDVRHLPRDEWAQTPAQRIMTPRERVVTVAGDAKALDILHMIAEKHLNQVPVIEDGRMVGLITRRELLDRVQLAESLARDEDVRDAGTPPEPAPHDHA